MTAAEADDDPTSDDAVMQGGAIVFDLGDFVEPAALTFYGPGGVRSLRLLTKDEAEGPLGDLLNNSAVAAVADGWHASLRPFVAVVKERDDAEAADWRARVPL